MSLGIGLIIGILALITAVSIWISFRLHRDNTKLRQQLALLESTLPQTREEPTANTDHDPLAVPITSATTNIEVTDASPESEHSGTDQENEKENIPDGPLAKSRIARTGLTQGTLAPTFKLPRIDGGELSLEEYRGQKVLLVFSAPDCGPCNLLAPELQKLARRTPDIQVIMVSRGDRETNQLKAKEYGLTFPIVLQRHWEISRQYAMFATPIAYLIDEHGIVAADVAVGPSLILNLLVGSAILSLLNGQRVPAIEAQKPEHETELSSLT